MFWLGVDAGLALPKPGCPCAHHRLRPVGDVELAEDVGHVIGDRLGAQRELVDDLRVAPALRDQA